MSSFFNIIGHSELLGHGEGANSQSTSCSLGEGGEGGQVSLYRGHWKHSIPGIVWGGPWLGCYYSTDH